MIQKVEIRVSAEGEKKAFAGKSLDKLIAEMDAYLASKK